MHSKCAARWPDLHGSERLLSVGKDDIDDFLRQYRTWRSECETRWATWIVAESSARTETQPGSSAYQHRTGSVRTAVFAFVGFASATRGSQRWITGSAADRVQVPCMQPTPPPWSSTSWLSTAHRVARTQAASTMHNASTVQRIARAYIVPCAASVPGIASRGVG
eukprot:3847796-Rhodomonas_salina.6